MPHDFRRVCNGDVLQVVCSQLAGPAVRVPRAARLRSNVAHRCADIALADSRVDPPLAQPPADCALQAALAGVAEFAVQPHHLLPQVQLRLRQLRVVYAQLEVRDGAGTGGQVFALLRCCWGFGVFDFLHINIIGFWYIFGLSGPFSFRLILGLFAFLIFFLLLQNRSLLNSRFFDRTTRIRTIQTVHALHERTSRRCAGLTPLQLLLQTTRCQTTGRQPLL